MRFIDANVFVHAILKPRKLDREAKNMKERARSIFNRFNAGEEVLTTIVHTSEVANVLEDAAGFRFAAEFARNLLCRANLRVVTVTVEQYLAASELALENEVGVNDGLAALIMKEKGLTQAYSFDKHLDRLGVARIID